MEIAAAGEANSMLASLNWAAPTWDLFILLFFVAAGVLYGFTLGRARVLFILMSLYISLAVSTNLPFINEESSQRLGFSQVAFLQIAVFLVCVVGLFLLFARVGALSTFSAEAGIVQIIVFSFLQVGLLISIVLSFLPETALASLGPFTKTLFAADNSRFLWMLAPLAAMFFMKKKSSE
ncbi:hypothetical protein KJ903_00915 [Patescibacteria group bacterium]|nr:hypothetical protein [Patescibacteria group bacterium]